MPGQAAVGCAVIYQFPDAVSLAYTGTKVYQRIKRPVIDRPIGPAAAIGHFYSHCLMIVGCAAGCPGSVAFLYVHAYPAIGAYAVVAGCLAVGGGEDVAYGFYGQIACHVVDGDFGDGAVAWVVAVGGYVCVGSQGAI